MKFDTMMMTFQYAFSGRSNTSELTRKEGELRGLDIPVAECRS